MNLLLYRAKQIWDSVADLFLAHTGGWVVIAVPSDDEIKAYHAVGGGRDYGMDYATGRFPSRKAALAYAAFRGTPEELQRYGMDYTFIAVHETRTNIRLLGD
ncbi:hypothetical protein [Xanthomonas phage vB_XooS_NR08]|nr:hypothetical protein [Xanthomonas phage vB_XooS_NR08]